MVIANCLLNLHAPKENAVASVCLKLKCCHTYKLMLKIEALSNFCTDMLIKLPLLLLFLHYLRQAHHLVLEVLFQW